MRPGSGRKGEKEYVHQSTSLYLVFSLLLLGCRRWADLAHRRRKAAPSLGQALPSLISSWEKIENPELPPPLTNHQLS